MKGKQNLSMPRKRSGVTGRPRRFPVSLLFLWVLAFFLFQGLGFPAWSAPNPAISGKPESLTVVIDDNYPPYIFVMPPANCKASSRTPGHFGKPVPAYTST